MDIDQVFTYCFEKETVIYLLDGIFLWSRSWIYAKYIQPTYYHKVCILKVEMATHPQYEKHIGSHNIIVNLAEKHITFFHSKPIM